MTEEEIQKIWFTGFDTDFWRLLKEHLEDQKSVVNLVENCKDEADFREKKGEVRALSWILNLEETLKSVNDL